MNVLAHTAHYTGPFVFAVPAVLAAAYWLFTKDEEPDEWDPAPESEPQGADATR